MTVRIGLSEVTVGGPHYMLRLHPPRRQDMRRPDYRSAARRDSTFSRMYPRIALLVSGESSIKMRRPSRPSSLRTTRPRCSRVLSHLKPVVCGTPDARQTLETD